MRSRRLLCSAGRKDLELKKDQGPLRETEIPACTLVSESNWALFHCLFFRLSEMCAFTLKRWNNIKIQGCVHGEDGSSVGIHRFSCFSLMCSPMKVAYLLCPRYCSLSILSFFQRAGSFHQQLLCMRHVKMLSGMNWFWPKIRINYRSS